MKISCLLLLCLVFFTGCATSAIPIVKTSPLSPEAEVNVFMKEADVGKTFVVVGAVHHYNFGKFQRVDFVDVLPILKEKARTLGANGLIIDRNDVVYSGVFSRGIDIDARAIKYDVSK